MRGTSEARQSRSVSGPRDGTAHFARLKARRYPLRRRAADSALYSSLVTGTRFRSWFALCIDGRAGIFLIFGFSGLSP